MVKVHMTTDMAAARLRITRQGVHFLIRTGKLKARKCWTGKGPVWLVYTKSMNEFAASRRLSRPSKKKAKT